MKRKKQRKAWLDNQSRKYQKAKYHKKRRSHGIYVSSAALSEQSKSDQLYFRVNESLKLVPRIFSFVNNTAETIDFFDDVVIEIKQKKYKNNFYIDSKNVEEVSVDALIYLIAIMQNITINYQMKYSFRGNLPNNNTAAEVYNNSGFMSYVKSKARRLPASSDKIQIKSGNNTDSIIASEFCKFVMDKLNKTLKDVLPLQKVLIELMSNVYHHAYNNDDIMQKKWYLYAEHNQEIVRFVFVDTGSGIAKTVRKNFWEKLQRFSKVSASDSDLIYSTLQGDFRTETRKPHRGNGLSGVKDLALNNIFKNFTIISGSGQCCIVQNGVPNSILKRDFDNKICGTMFLFDIV